MRGIKPFRLSLLTRPFQVKSERWFGVSALAFFPFDQPGAVLTDMEMWQFLPKVLGQDLAIDAGIPKSRSEVLVSGAAFPPGQRPSPTVPVRVQIGQIDKTLYVIGDRVWRRGTPTEPRPFTRMELGWENAFGGPDYAKNPRGKGAAPIQGERGEEIHPLPNVELPGKLITSPKERPEPASFGPIDFSWPQRFSLAGTYDQRWLETHYPGFAADLDWRIWNVAAPDQQQDSPFAPDERFVLMNLHPERDKIEGRLPNLKARCFITQKTETEERFREIDLRLTTVWLFPEHERGVVIFQGGVEVAEDDASDVVNLMIAGERPGEPRPLEHYRAVLDKRLDPANLAEALNDADLMPPGAVGLAPEVERAKELTTIEGLRAKRQRAKMKGKIEESRAKLEALGLDPDEHGPALLPDEPEPPSLSELPEFVKRMREEAERMKLEADAERERTLELAEEFYAEVGLDFDEVEREMKTGASGPPPFTADGQRASMRRLADETAALGQPSEELEHYATDPEIYAKWKAIEERLREGYRTSAHFQEPAPRKVGDERDEQRRFVLERVGASESLAGVDLTGADLSELDLTGADFSDALLESASFSKTRLDRARFDRAVLAHASFEGASIGGASFAEANLGKALLVDLDGREPANLRGANLWEATIRGSDLRGANLEGVSFWGATIEDTDLSGANLARSVFHKTALARAKLVDADLSEATFMELDVSGLDFAGALCAETVFLRCRAERCNFKNGRLTNLRVVLESDFSGSDFRGATLDKANLRGVALREADFSGAKLNGADLSEADLEGAKAYRIVARESMWMKCNLRSAFFVSADLFGASLQKADVRGTDFRGANLYGCDFALVRSDAGTNVEDAIQSKVRYLPKRAQ